RRPRPSAGPPRRPAPALTGRRRCAAPLRPSASADDPSCAATAVRCRARPPDPRRRALRRGSSARETIPTLPPRGGAPPRPAPGAARLDCSTGRAAGDRRDALVFLHLRIERSVIEHVHAVHFPRNRAAALARLPQDSLGFGDAFTRFFGVRLLPFDDLMASPV